MPDEGCSTGVDQRSAAASESHHFGRNLLFPA